VDLVKGPQTGSLETSMSKRTSFPPVFWIANLIEVLERFAYYGVYLALEFIWPLWLYTRSAGRGAEHLFIVVLRYPRHLGSFADRFGFKKVLIISYLAYLPSILLLIVTKSFSGIALTMLSIGLAAGIFKPLVSGTVRVTTDSTNKSLDSASSTRW